MPTQKKSSSVTNARQPNYSIETAQPDNIAYNQQYSQELLKQSIEESLKQDLFSSKFNLGEYQKYQGSKEQLEVYENLELLDPSFRRYVISSFGSYDNYLRMNNIKVNPFVTIDPRTDFKADVTIRTQNKFFKSDNISSVELIMEALSGKCTVDYLDKYGRARKMLGSLNQTVLPPDKIAERVNFFSPLINNRVVLFDLIKQDWSSFFMGNLIRFVRDDTIGIE